MLRLIRSEYALPLIAVGRFRWTFAHSSSKLAPAFGAIIDALLTTPATLRWQWQLARQKRRISDAGLIAGSILAING